MAKLRRLGRGLTAAGQSLGDMITRQEARDREERLRQAALALERLQHQNTMERVQAQEREQLRRQLLSHPEQAERMQAQGGAPPGIDPTRYGRSEPERVRPLLEGVEGAKTPGEVPSAPSLLGRARTEGLDTSSFPIPNPMTGAVAGQAASRPPIQELMRARQEKEASSKRAVEEKMRADVKHFLPGGAQGRELPGGETLIEELDPTAKGKATTQEALAGELSTVYKVAEAQAANMVERLTRGEKVKTAGQTAAATAEGRIGVELNPMNVAREAGRAGLIASAQERAKAQAPGAEGARTTQGERDAGAMFVALVNGHGRALEQEKKGAYIMPGLTTTLTSPIAGAIAGGMYPPAAVQYGTTALDFINTYTRLMSGVAARPDEIDRYTSSLFKQPSDTPKSAAAKQSARAVFMAAGQIKVQNGGFAAGRALGRAVEMGAMTPEVLASIKYEPEIIRGLMSVIDLPPEVLARIR